MTLVLMAGILVLSIFLALAGARLLLWSVFYLMKPMPQAYVERSAIVGHALQREHPSAASIAA